MATDIRSSRARLRFAFSTRIVVMCAHAPINIGRRSLRTGSGRQVTAPDMSQRGGKLGPTDEMDDDEFGVVDLDAVDDDRDVDTDAATATTTPEELRRRIDESVKLPQSPRRAVSLPASVAPIARGAAIGAGVAVEANAVRKPRRWRGDPRHTAGEASGASQADGHRCGDRGRAARARHRAAAADRR